MRARDPGRLPSPACGEPMCFTAAAALSRCRRAVRARPRPSMWRTSPKCRDTIRVRACSHLFPHVPAGVCLSTSCQLRGSLRSCALRFVCSVATLPRAVRFGVPAPHPVLESSLFAFLLLCSDCVCFTDLPGVDSKSHLPPLSLQQVLCLDLLLHQVLPVFARGEPPVCVLLRGWLGWSCWSRMHARSSNCALAALTSALCCLMCAALLVRSGSRTTARTSRRRSATR